MRDEEDDDIMIYDSSPTKLELWSHISRLQDRIKELEQQLNQPKPDTYFGEK